MTDPTWCLGAVLPVVTQGASVGCLGVAAGRPIGTPNLWFDPCAFAIEPLGTLGNEGRNIFPGPGLANLDFSVVKDTALPLLGEAGRLEFRAEFFNILNHPNFQMPANQVFSGSLTAQQDVEAPVATAGQITTTGSYTARQIQFALKVLF